MAELTDLRGLGYQASGDSGFGAFGDQPPGGFMRVGYAPQGGLLGSVFGKVLKVGKGLVGKLIGGGSSKVAKAAKAAKKAALAAAKSPVVQAATIAGGTELAVQSMLPGASAPVMQGGAVPIQLPDGTMTMARMRTPSIIYDATGRAWRRAGRPVLWSGDLSAVRRVNKAASRARRASGSRRSVRR